MTRCHDYSDAFRRPRADGAGRRRERDLLDAGLRSLGVQAQSPQCLRQDGKDRARARARYPRCAISVDRGEPNSLTGHLAQRCGGEGGIPNPRWSLPHARLARPKYFATRSPPSGEAADSTLSGVARQASGDGYAGSSASRAQGACFAAESLSAAASRSVLVLALGSLPSCRRHCGDWPVSPSDRRTSVEQVPLAPPPRPISRGRRKASL